METFIRMSGGDTVEVHQDADVAGLVDRLETSGGGIDAIVAGGRLTHEQ